MPVEYEEPTVTGAPRDRGKVYSHPSYAQISAYRAQGYVNLYGSDFTHHRYVTIRIRRSVMQRDLSHDWPLERDEIVEVQLSEAQWAAFVASMSVGTGIPCTLSALGGTRVPQLPKPKSVAEQFKAEADEKLLRSIAELNDLRLELSNQELKIPAKVREGLKDKVNRAHQNLTSNLKFVARSFGEQMERHAEKVKAELSAWMQAAIHRAGLADVASNGPVTLETTTNDKDKEAA